jgi:general secretion pathway protein C
MPATPSALGPGTPSTAQTRLADGINHPTREIKRANALNLFAVERGRNANEGRALIGRTAVDAVVYVAGALLPTGARLVAVLPDAVELEQDGERWTVPVTSTRQRASSAHGSTVPTSVGETERATDAAVRSESLPLSDVVRMTAVYEGSALHGYRLYPGADATSFDRLRLQAGDVLISIDGEAITNPAQVLGMLTALGEGASVSVSVRRVDRVITTVLTINRDLPSNPA